MSLRLTAVHAVEILDSRGRPTLAVDLTTPDGRFSAAVPSGASTGSGEAVELRDGDAARFGGKGVLTAVGHVNGELAELLLSQTWPDLATLDDAMITADGTPNKSRLGANALVGLSMAAARAFAGGRELWQTFDIGAPSRLPVPHFNVVNGGAHAPNALDFQEFMIAPLGAPSLPEAVRAGAEVYAALRARLAAGDTPPDWEMRAASPPISPSPRRCWPCSWRPLPTPATRRAGTVWRSRSTRPPASSSTATAITSPDRSCRATI